ncbi:MAG: nuclear transport factor 2 family protein [Betaproteobacteria bacterium]|nr:nuclear transport factor 2 family protein [Betaproteobacteria bacterium]
MTGKPLTLEYLQEIIEAFNSRNSARIVSYFTEDCTFLA